MDATHSRPASSSCRQIAFLIVTGSPLASLTTASKYCGHTCARVQHWRTSLSQCGEWGNVLLVHLAVAQLAVMEGVLLLLLPAIHGMSYLNGTQAVAA